MKSNIQSQNNDEYFTKQKLNPDSQNIAKRIPIEKDSRGNNILYYFYDSLEKFSCQYALVSFNNRYGYIDKNYILSIHLQYDYASSFSENLAAVMIQGKWGFINTKGGIAISFEYDYAASFAHGLAAVKKNNKWGFIDKSGTLVRPYRHNLCNPFNQDIYSASGNKLLEASNPYIEKLHYDYVGSFRHGLACVRLDNKWGYVDQIGTLIIPFIYEYATIFTQGLASVKKNNKWGCIDRSGKVIIPFLYEYIDTFSQGLARVKYEGKWAVIDKNAQLYTPFIYDYELQNSARSNYKEMTIFKEGNYWGWQLTHSDLGHIPSYTAYEIFSNSLIKFTRKDGTFDVTNFKGQVKLSEVLHIDVIKNSLACFKDSNGMYGAVNHEGDIIIVAVYKNIKNCYAGMIAVQVGQQWLLKNHKGEYIDAGFYDSIGEFNDNIVQVEQNHQWEYIDTSGKSIAV